MQDELLLLESVLGTDAPLAASYTSGSYQAAERWRRRFR